MNNTNLPCSIDDTTELRKLIIENPDLPLIVFAGEEAWSGDYCYSQSLDVRASIDTLGLYGDVWMDRDDYRDRLVDDLCDEEEYKNLSDEDYFKMIDQKIAETEFVKAIVIYVG